MPVDPVTFMNNSISAMCCEEILETEKGLDAFFSMTLSFIWNDSARVDIDGRMSEGRQSQVVLLDERRLDILIKVRAKLASSCLRLSSL
ncbi:hypothetical protein TNCT_665581 [Trichonephila clavata]|uniref:Uncharacterized protein n=1 Tax=Trichonephila clavata TaxID=2740835 RepID=A0A8X6GDS9_TRICU|nr:hypothetical protein TNCT_665581 [Trichonephila clavata]